MQVLENVRSPAIVKDHRTDCPTTDDVPLIPRDIIIPVRRSEADIILLLRRGVRVPATLRKSAAAKERKRRTAEVKLLLLIVLAIRAIPRLDPDRENDPRREAGKESVLVRPPLEGEEEEEAEEREEQEEEGEEEEGEEEEEFLERDRVRSTWKVASRGSLLHPNISASVVVPGLLARHLISVIICPIARFLCQKGTIPCREVLGKKTTKRKENTGTEIHGGVVVFPILPWIY